MSVSNTLHSLSQILLGTRFANATDPSKLRSPKLLRLLSGAFESSIEGETWLQNLQLALIHLANIYNLNFEPGQFDQFYDWIYNHEIWPAAFQNTDVEHMPNYVKEVLTEGDIPWYLLLGKDKDGSQFREALLGVLEQFRVLRARGTKYYRSVLESLHEATRNRKRKAGAVSTVGPGLLSATIFLLLLPQVRAHILRKENMYDEGLLEMKELPPIAPVEGRKMVREAIRATSKKYHPDKHMHLPSDKRKEMENYLSEVVQPAGKRLLARFPEIYESREPSEE